MRKLLILVATLLLATSAFALNETASNGPQNITRCWMTGTAACTSGNVVVLQTTSPTYPGKQVTGTSTAEQKIYGVVVSTPNYTPAEMSTGKWIRVQTYGYNAIIKVTTSTSSSGGAAAITAGDGLATSGVVFVAKGNGTAVPVTGGAVALEAEVVEQTTGTIKGWLGW